MSLVVTSVKRVKNPKEGVKLYASVLNGLTRKIHAVVYIRTKNFRGFLCNCENFFFSCVGKNRNCKHIRLVRKSYGRFGTNVPLS